MEQKEIFELISRFENSSLNVLEIEQDSFKLHMEKGIRLAAAPLQPAAEPVLTLKTLRRRLWSIARLPFHLHTKP